MPSSHSENENNGKECQQQQKFQRHCTYSTKHTVHDIVKMADFRADHELVTKFLLSTCRLGLRELLYGNIVEAVGACALVVSDDDETSKIPVITGSAAEFYIEPMLSCVGDHDLMFHRSDELAIPTGTAPPTQLPDDFDSRVDVYEIVDREFPLFRLRVLDVVLRTDRMY